MEEREQGKVGLDRALGETKDWEEVTRSRVGCPVPEKGEKGIDGKTCLARGGNISGSITQGLQDRSWG